MEREPRPIVELSVHDPDGSYGNLLMEGVHVLKKEYDLGVLYTPETDWRVKEKLKMEGIPVVGLRALGHLYGYPGTVYDETLNQAFLRADRAQPIIYLDGDRFAAAAKYYRNDLQMSIEGIGELIEKRKKDCVSGSRTREAINTHPDSQKLTEGIIQEAYSHVLGVEGFDPASGLMGFSERGAKWVLKSKMLQWTRGQFTVEYPLAVWTLRVALEGGRLDSFSTGMAGMWETAITDETKEKPGHRELEKFLRHSRKRADSTENWKKRVEILRVWLLHLHFALLTKNIECKELQEATEQLDEVGKLKKASEIKKAIEEFHAGFDIEKLPSLKEAVGRHPEIE